MLNETKLKFEDWKDLIEKHNQNPNIKDTVWVLNEKDGNIYFDYRCDEFEMGLDKDEFEETGLSIQVIKDEIEYLIQLSNDNWEDIEDNFAFETIYIASAFFILLESIRLINNNKGEL